MAGYEVAGGPCHFDITLHFIVAIGKELMGAEGYVDDEGNTNEKYRANAAGLKNRNIKRLKNRFDSFFNPSPGGKLYTFPPERPCCNYHLNADFEAADSSLDNLDEKQARAAMRGKPGKTLIQLEPESMSGHPHADIGGQVMELPSVATGDKGIQSFPHEIGHILGLEDQYKTKYNHITDQQEKEHQGQLMGKPLSNGQREITAQEAGEIATKAGLTCDFDKCCVRQAHPLPGGDQPSTGETKSLKSLYCPVGFVLVDPEGAEAERDDGVPLATAAR